MIRLVAEEAAALVAIVLFAAAVLVWAQVLS